MHLHFHNTSSIVVLMHLKKTGLHNCTEKKHECSNAVITFWTPLIVGLVYSTFVFSSISYLKHRGQSVGRGCTHITLEFWWGNHHWADPSSLAWRKNTEKNKSAGSLKVNQTLQEWADVWDSLTVQHVHKLLTVHFWADRVLWLESLSDPKLSLLDLAATGPKVLFGLCSSEATLLESAVGSGGPGGRRGSTSESLFPAVGKELLVGCWSGAAAVGGEAWTAAGLVGTEAVESSLRMMGLVVCGWLWVDVTSLGALTEAWWVNTLL